MKKSVLLSVLMLLVWSGSVFAIVISPTSDADTLANTLVTDPNIIINSNTYSGGTGASGTFTDGNTSGLAINQGILLTTGSAPAVANPPGSFASSGTGVGGSIISGSTDETSLTIKFTPMVNPVVSFQFVFGSEEYPEWVGSSFNDAFVFILNGNNIALLPDSTVIAINSVNQNTYLNTYFTYGAPGIVYDGLVGNNGPSYLLYATGPVVVGAENTLTIAIADRGDSIYDSGVFLKGLVNEPPPPPNGKTPEPATMLLLGSGLLGLWPLRKKIMK